MIGSSVRRAGELFSLFVLLSYLCAVFLRMRTLLSSSGGAGGRIRESTVHFTTSGSNFCFVGGFFFLFKNASTSPLTIFAFSSTLLSYGSGSRGLRDVGLYWYRLPAA